MHSTGTLGPRTSERTASPRRDVRLHVPAGLPRTVAVTLAAVVALLALGNVAALVARHGLGLGEIVLLELKHEQTFGTWVNSVLLLACGALAAANGALAARRHEGWVRNWLLLAAALVVLSMDEVVALHDRAMEPLRGLLGASGVFYYAWIVPAIALVLVFLLLQVGFLRALGRPTGLALFLAGALYVGGAVGLEMVEGLLASSGRGEGLAYDVATLVEETIELGSMAWVVHVLLSHLMRRAVEDEALQPRGQRA